jgi:hypothetical protein
MVTVMDERLNRLGEPHIAPLMALVEDMRARGLNVPNVDPNDGGTNARVLCLLESPGPKAVGSAFISRDNPDPSARNIGRLLDSAGLKRRDVVLWNVVPWAISTAEKNRNATAQDIRAAVPGTQAFIDALPQLVAVVFCGQSAQRAAALVGLPPGVQAFLTYHPGAQSYYHAHLREHMEGTYRKVAALLADSHA